MESSDEEIQPEDEQFFAEHGEYLQILEKMPTGARDTKETRKEPARIRAEAYEEAGARRNRDWEHQSRPSKLPLKLGGHLVPVAEPIVSASFAPHVEEAAAPSSTLSVSVESVEQEEDSYHSSSESDAAPDQLELRFYMKRHSQLLEAKKQIALLASSVMEDAQENVRL